MSIQAIAWAFAQAIPPSAKLVLLALADHADSDGHCWPGFERLAEMTGLHRATIVRCLDKLEEHELIARVRRPNKSNTYRLSVVSRMVRPDQSHGATPEVAECDHGSRMVRPKPSVTINEPPKKRQAQREQRLPEDWQPDADLLAWAATSFPNLDTAHETDCFRDYFLGKGTRYLDWRRAWRNWMRRSAKSHGGASVSRMHVDGRRRHSYDPYLAALDRHGVGPVEQRPDQPRLLVIDGGRRELDG